MNLQTVSKLTRLPSLQDSVLVFTFDGLFEKKEIINICSGRCWKKK